MTNHTSAVVLALCVTLAAPSVRANQAPDGKSPSALEAFFKDCVVIGMPGLGQEVPPVGTEKCAALLERAGEQASGRLDRILAENPDGFLAEAERLWPVLSLEARERFLPEIRKRVGPQRPASADGEPAPRTMESAAAEGLTDALNSKPGVGLARAYDGSAARVDGTAVAVPPSAAWGLTARVDDPRLGLPTPSRAAPPKARREPAPVPLFAFPVREAPEKQSWAAWAGNVVSEAGKRTAHSVASVVMLPFEGVGTAIQAGGGGLSVAVGAVQRAYGRATGSEESVRRGELTMARGSALMTGTLSRAVNAVARPVTVLLNPKYEVMSTRELSGPTTTDAQISRHLEEIAREKPSLSKAFRYGLAYTASFTDKAAQVLLGGGALKSLPGVVQALTLGSVAVNVKEQGTELVKAYLEAKPGAESEAALAAMVKAGGDFAVMFGAGLAANKAGGAPGGGARFIDSAQARDLIIDATARLNHVKQLLKEHGRPEMPLAEQQALFQQLMGELVNPPNGPKTSDGPVGLTVFDNDAGLTASKRWQALGVEAAWLEKMGIVKDHHGPFFDPKAPEVDSTMKLLDRVEQVLASEGPRGALKVLRAELKNVSTNNLGDGAWADWISHNLERVVGDPALRRRLREATGYEDFGFFGAKAAEAAKENPSAAAARELQHAAFRAYDRALARHGIKGSDRFDSLPPAQQARLMAEVRGELSRAVEDPAFRRSQAAEFESRLEAAKLQVEEAAFGLDAASREALARKGVPPTALDGLFVYDAGKINADGQFAGWGAAPQAHGGQILLGVRPMADGRTGFILSVPNGMEAPSLAPLGQALRAVEAAREGGGKPGNIGGRDSLQFSFDGLRMTPQELLMAVAEARAKGVQGGPR